ncbi:hypothetical protein CF8_0134 [Aeromonas phage CF8]|nr:hypothetical protein CF8_0134 [Aeromonas phage CF8]
MKVDKDKPLNPTTQKDPVGQVLDAFIRVDRKMQENGTGSSDEDRVILDITMNNAWPREDGITDPPIPIPEPGAIIEMTQEEAIQEIKTAVSVKLDEFAGKVDAQLETHTVKTGTVHGETKETVGLGKKDNWGMATIDQHQEGVADNLYCHPAGLLKIIDTRMKVDPRSYLPARSIPIACGGLLGEVPQWKYDYFKGELVQSPTDPKAFLGETAFEFSTQNGMQIFGCMNNSPELGRYTPMPSGTAPEVQTPHGGTKVRSYAGRTDLKRSRPSHIKGWRSPGNLGTAVKVMENMFEPSAVSFMEGSRVCLRSFNRGILPFDVLKTTERNSVFEGIFESSESYLFNFVTKPSFGVYQGESTSAVHLVLTPTVYNLTPWELELQEGPPDKTPEYISENPTQYQTSDISVPVGGKLIGLDYSGNGNKSVVIPFKELFTLPAGSLSEFFSKLDIRRLRKMTFAWRTKLRYQGVLRLYLGWFNKDNTKYWHTYLDLELSFSFDDVTKTTTMNVTTGPDWDLPKQTLTDNWDLVGNGLMVEYTPHVKEQPDHPLCQSGIFESSGGHLRTFTMYNRQYVGKYEHDVGFPLEYLDRGRGPFPTITKYSYSPQSTINQDGMYGDHLRHIPISITSGESRSFRLSTIDLAANNRWPKMDGTQDPVIPIEDPSSTMRLKITYLTLTRDYRNRYRWALVDSDATRSYIQGNSYGSYLAPDSTNLVWLSEKFETVPSFLIENDDLSDVMNVNNLVFNEHNRFTNYLEYTLNNASLDTPLTFTNPVSIHDEILSWIGKNAGNWQKQHKTFFYFKSTLFWMNQCLSSNDYPANGKDCFYGIIKNCYVHVDSNGKKTLKARDGVANAITVNSMNVNKKASLQINQGEILGFDQFKTQDIYLMKKSEAIDSVKWDVMLNVAPFNNFFIEMSLTHNPLTDDYTFGPSLNAQDPIFPYDPVNGYQIDYDKEILYGTKLPHRLHVNYQSPVMLAKGMWSFRKTPNNYGVFTRRYGFMTYTGGLMGTSEGFTLYPIGGVITHSGKNTIIKSPVKIRIMEFFGYDELFVRAVGENFIPYGRFNNPNGYEIEPHSGGVPAGFINGSEFSYQDQSGWRNAFFPIIDGKRLNITGDGSSFPVFLGRPGSSLPINRFFKENVSSRLMWDTTKGRVIPIVNRAGGSPILIINGTSYPLSGLNSFTIPGSYTGTIMVDIYGVSVLKWGAGLSELVTIGNRVTELDFSGSSSFKISCDLPKTVSNFNRVFLNATATSYPGLEYWDMGNVYTMNECFKDAVNFNQDLSRWTMDRLATYIDYDKGAVKWTLPRPTIPA